MIRLVNCIALFSIFIFANCVLALPTPKKTTLSWIAPTTNVDGSSLTDLGGYKIYWSTVNGNESDFSNEVKVNIFKGITPPKLQ